MDTLLYTPQQTLQIIRQQSGLKQLLYEGVFPRFRRSLIGKKEAEHHKTALRRKSDPYAMSNLPWNTFPARGFDLSHQSNEYCSSAANGSSKVSHFLNGIQEPLVQDVIRELLRKIDTLIDIGSATYPLIDRLRHCRAAKPSA